MSQPSEHAACQLFATTPWPIVCGLCCCLCEVGCVSAPCGDRLWRRWASNGLGVNRKASCGEGGVGVRVCCPATHWIWCAGVLGCAGMYRVHRSAPLDLASQHSAHKDREAFLVVWTPSIIMACIGLAFILSLCSALSSTMLITVPMSLSSATKVHFRREMQRSWETVDQEYNDDSILGWWRRRACGSARGPLTTNYHLL